MEEKEQPKKKGPNPKIEKAFETLGIKTSALWIACGIIADHNLMPGKNQQQLYDILLIMGKTAHDDYVAKKKAEQAKKSKKKKHEPEPEKPIRKIVMR